MVNISNRVKIRLVNNTKDYRKHVSKPNFVLNKIFSKNFTAIWEIKSVLTLNEEKIISEFVWVKSKYVLKLLWVVKKLKRSKGSAKMLLKTYDIKNILVFYLINTWKEFKANCIANNSK